MAVGRNLTLGFNAGFAKGWAQSVAAYIAYIAFRRNEVLDWKAATGQDNVLDVSCSLELLFADHHESIGRGMRNALDLWTGTSDFSNAAADTNYSTFQREISAVNAIVSGDADDIVKHVSAIGSALRAVHIVYLHDSYDSYGSASYPYTMRVVNSAEDSDVAIRKVIMRLGIKRFGAITCEGQPYSSFLGQSDSWDVQFMVAQLPHLGNESRDVLDLTSSLAMKWRDSIRVVVSHGYRIFVLIANSAHAHVENVMTLQVAYHEGFCGSEFFWLIDTAIEVERFANKEAFPPSSAYPNGGLDAFRGALMVGYWYPNEDVLRQLYRKLTLEDFPELIRKNLHGALPDEAVLFRDEATMHSFNAVAFFIAASYRLLSLGYQPDDIRGQLLLDSADAVSFAGIGVVCAPSHKCWQSYGLYNLQEDGNGTSHFKMVGELLAKSSDWVLTSPIVYPDGGSEPVADEATCQLGYGWGNNGSLIGCVPCPPGQYGRGGSFPCFPCAKGAFQASSAQNSCTLAAVGHVVPYSGSLHQIPCAPGSFVAAVGQVVCQSCGMGRATNRPGSKACDRCPQGKFTASVGARSCENCPAGMTTRLSGASSEEECVCDTGKFFSSKASSCKHCGEGLICDTPSNEIPELAYGFSADAVFDQADFDGLQVYNCVGKASCPGGKAGTCSAHGSGVACAECHRGHYWDGQVCKQCSAYHKPWLDIVVPIAMVIGIALVTLIISNSPQTAELAYASDVCVALSLTINIVTTLTVVSNFLLEWQGPIKDVLTIAHYVMMPVHLFGLQCTIGNNFVISYLFVSLMPMLPVITLLASMIVFRRRFPLWKLVNAGGQIFYGCFVVIVLHALKPVILYKHPNGRYSITHNPQTLTNTDEYNHLILIAIVQMLLYCGGYLVFCGSAVFQLRTLRKKIGMRVKPEELLWRYRFLFFRFKAEYYYWGLVFLLRSALISLVTVVRPDLPHVQIIFLVILLAIFLCLHCTNWPCRNMSHNIADAIVQGFLLCFVSACGAFRSTSSEDASDFISNVLTVLFSCFFCIIGCVLVLPLKRSIQRWRSPDTSVCREPVAGFVTELLEKPCDAVLEVPLPSSLLDMSDATNANVATEEMVIGGIAIARTPSQQSTHDGSFASGTAERFSQFVSDTTPASVKLSIGGSGGVDRLRVSFRSKAIASRDTLLQDFFEHERKIFEMTRAVMAAMLNGMFTLKHEAENAYRVEWCDQKATDMLLGRPAISDASVHRWIAGTDSAESSEGSAWTSSGGGDHWPRSMLRGQLLNAYLGEEARTFQFLNSLISDSHIAHQISTTMVKRSGERFACELFAVRSASSEILLGIRAAPGPMKLLPSESTAIMSLHNGVLGSCTPLWNMYFRRNMNGKPLLPQVPVPEDKVRLSKAVEALMRTGETQGVHNLSLKQHKSTSQFQASLVLTDAGVGDPSEVKIILQDISPQWRLQRSANRCTASGSADSDDHSVISTHVMSQVSSARPQSSPGNLQSAKRPPHATPRETIQLGLMELMQHFDAPVQCCAWHATAQLLHSGVLALAEKKLSCDVSWKPFSDWQCQHCKALNEFESSFSECVVCGTAQEPLLQSDMSRSSPAVNTIIKCSLSPTVLEL